MPVLGDLGFANATFSDADFAAAGILLGNAAKFFGSTGVIVTVIVAVLIPIIWSALRKNKSVDATKISA
jgi:PTS system ascorbate-specific IIC component